jgi:outer membrane protein assembly factor BamE
MHKTARSLLFPLFIVCSTLLVGCGSSVPVIKPFKMDIQQGNVVTSKMLLQLRPGMTKSQVKFIMGTPLVIDSFHNNRWDYFYQLRQAGKVVEQRRVILDFEKDLLARVRGDVVPQGTPGADTGAVVLSKEPAPATPKPAEKEGILENLKFWKSREAPENGESTEVKPSAEPVTPESKPVTKETVPNEAIKHEPTPEVAAPVSEPAATETPSLLAVPISITPIEDAPVVESQPIETKSVVAPVEALPAVTTAPDLPIKPEAVKQDDERLRLDRNLDTKNIDSNNASQEPIKSTTKPVEKTSDVEQLPTEEEPGYFERLLEKIGF